MDTCIVGQHTEKITQRVLKINASSKSLVGRLSDFNIYVISVLCFIGSVCAPDNATLKTGNHVFQCATAGPYNHHTICISWGLAPFVVLVLIWWAFTPSASRLAIELQHARPRLADLLKRSVRLENANALLLSLSFSQLGTRNLCSIHGF